MEAVKKICLTLGLSACVYLPMRVIFRISELLCSRRSNILTEDLYHKIFVEVSKVTKYREVHMPVHSVQLP